MSHLSFVKVRPLLKEGTCNCQMHNEHEQQLSQQKTTELYQ